MHQAKQCSHNVEQRIFVTFCRSIHNIHHHCGLLRIPVVLESQKFEGQMMVFLKHFAEKENCSVFYSHHADPATLHMRPIDRALQVDDPTVVRAQPGGVDCIVAWWELLWATPQQKDTWTSAHSIVSRDTDMLHILNFVTQITGQTFIFTTFSTHEIHIEQKWPNGENGRFINIIKPNQT